MKIKYYLTAALLFMAFALGNAQVILTEAAPNVMIDFSASMQTTVGTNPSTAYRAAGFSPNPTVAGRLNSNAWDIRGFDFGTLGFGGTQTVDDFGRGQVTTAVISGGLYAYTELPGSAANPAFMVQPTDTDFNPGSIVLKLRNSGTTAMTQLSVSYDLFVRNDEGRSSSFNFSHSQDDVVYQDEPTLDYVSPEEPDAFQWTAIGVSPARSIIITGINVLPGQFYYLRWTCQDVGGAGDRDEFGLDNIAISATYGPPAPEINVKGVSGVTILSGDTTPSVAEGTDFAPIGSPLSTVGASLNTTFQIQNLGGAILNVSNITITGAQASDFTIFIPSPTNLPTGDIAPAGSPTNFRELTIKFDPSDEGLRKARVTIYNNDSNEGTYWFDIQGYGLIPKPDMNVKGNTGGTSNITSGNMIPVAGNNTLWLADQLVGTSVSKDYRIQNTANIASVLQLTGTPIVQISGANPEDFVVTTQPTSTNINGGFGTNFVITFTPQAAGIRTALVTIPNNDLINDPFTGLPESPYTFLVQGKGVAPEIDITGNLQPIAHNSTTPSLLNHTFFDYLNIAGATLDRVYTIKNTGTMPLSIGALTLTGPSASEFSIISSPAATLAVNATTTFTIRFDPATVGVKDAFVNLVNGDFDENPYIFAIRGYGLDYVPCNFGPVETIAIQDFEATPATPTWTYTTTGTSTVNGGTAHGVAGDSGTSNRFIGARSLQVINSTSTVTFAAVNTMLYSDIELSFRVASLSTNATEGSDNTDKVIVAVSANGGLTWSNEFDLAGNTNSKWSFDSGTGVISNPYDGNNVIANFTTSGTGYVTTAGNSTLRLTNLPKTTNLMVRLTMVNNSLTEIWAIDNVALHGRKEVSTTWNGSTWSNGVPNQTTKAIFNGNYSTAAGNVTACKCQVNAGQTVTVQPGQFLSIESDIENAGSIVVENGGSLVQKNDYANNTGSVTVKRNSMPMRKYDYTYWSSPVASQVLINFSPETLSDKFYVFNTQSNVWQMVPSSSSMTPGVGFMIRSPQSFSTTATTVYPGVFNGPVNNGFVTPPVYNSVGSWNLVGNPYPSAINADTFLQSPANTGVIGGTIYFWTHNTPITNQQYTGNDYAVYNLLGGTGTMAAPNTGVNNTIPNGKIASGQGFFVMCHTPGNVTFNNSMRLTGNNNTFFRQSQEIGDMSLPSDTEKHRIWLDVYNDQGWFNQALVGFAEGALDDFDNVFDSYVANTAGNLLLYSLLDAGSEELAIQGKALPFEVSDRFRLGFKTVQAGTFTINIEGYDGLFENQNIYLEDKLLNIVHDLKQSPYEFAAEAGTFENRFELQFEGTQLGTPEIALENTLSLAVKDQILQLRSTRHEISEVSVYDLLGRNIYESRNVNSNEFSISSLAKNQQSLIVKVKLANGAVVSKKINY